MPSSKTLHGSRSGKEHSSDMYSCTYPHHSNPPFLRPSIPPLTLFLLNLGLNMGKKKKAIYENESDETGSTNFALV